jgi:hypothetical protein
MTAPTHEHERYNQVRYQRPERTRQADLPVEQDDEASGEDVEQVELSAPISGGPHWADEPPTPVVIVEEQEKPRVTHATCNTYSVDSTAPIKIVQQRRVIRDVMLKADAPVELRMSAEAGKQASYVLDSGDGQFVTHTTMTVWAKAQDATANISVWEEWTACVD